LIFFRWDFNNDGEWDTSWRLSLTMSDTIDWFYDDDYFDVIVVEAWDGISTSTIIHSGDILEGETTVNWIIYPATQGWKFEAKQYITITQLGYYRWAYYYSTRRLILWDASSQKEMASCTAGTSYYAWNWCSISPVTLDVQHEYVMSIWKGVNYYPYFPGTNWGNVETNTEYVEIKDFVYKWWPFGYPGSSGGSGQVIPLLDFKWQWVEIVPLTESDTAFLEVNNVAPNVYNVQTNPPMAYEGGETSFTAQFDDPGAGDDWEYRWDFGDGEFSNWRTVKKFDGGANVFILHTITYRIDFFKSGLIPACGNFCLTVDDFNMYTGGGIPSYDELLQYDVIIIVTNYPVPSQSQLGDMIADYMDEKGTAGSGGFIGMWDVFDTNVPWDIRGRWFDDEYSPVKKAYRSFSTTSMGTIYVPGHPILAGVTSFSVRYHNTVTQITSGATRIVDHTDGTIMAAEKENPVVNNGAISLALPWFPYPGYISGDWARLLANGVKYASRQP
ncbi:MAG: hypothetical protein KAW09_05565, partial [Thermoplasmata archaeon]|nr:hypothetical protein [Thermoplasmata archaeon]